MFRWRKCCEAQVCLCVFWLRQCCTFCKVLFAIKGKHIFKIIIVFSICNLEYEMKFMSKIDHKVFYSCDWYLYLLWSGKSSQNFSMCGWSKTKLSLPAVWKLCSFVISHVQKLPFLNFSLYSDFLIVKRVPSNENTLKYSNKKGIKI